MTTKLVALVLLCLVSGMAMAQESKVTSLMSKDLTENPGKEVLMITVEHAPGGSNAVHRHNAQAFVYVLEGSVVMQQSVLVWWLAADPWRDCRASSEGDAPWKCF
jgi:hypothetical protein